MAAFERIESSTSSTPVDLGRTTLPNSSRTDKDVDVCRLLIERLFTAGRSSQWDSFEKSLALFIKYSSSDNFDRNHLLNAREEKTGLPLISIISSNGAPAHVIDQMADFGACLTVRARGRVQGEMREELSPLHLALGNRHYLTALQLLRRGHPTELLDSYGATAFDMLLLNRLKSIPEAQVKSVIKMLIHFGATFSAEGNPDRGTLNSVVLCGYFEAAELISEHVKTLAIKRGETSWTKDQIQHLAYELITRPRNNPSSINTILDNLTALSAFSKRSGSSADQTVQKKLIEILEEVLDRSDTFFWRECSQILGRLHHSSGLFEESLIRDTINTPLQKKNGLRIPLLHHALCLDAPPKTIDLLARMGADVNQSAAIGTTDIAGLGLLIQQSPLYLALEKQHYQKAAILLRAGASVPRASADDGHITALPHFFYRSALTTINELLNAPEVIEKVFGPGQIRSWILEHYQEFKPQMAIRLALQCPRSAQTQPTTTSEERSLTTIMERIIELLDLQSEAPWQSAALIEHCTKNLFLAEAAALLQAGGDIPAIYLDGRSATEYSSEELSALRSRLLMDYSFLLFDSGAFAHKNTKLDKRFIAELLTYDYEFFSSKYPELADYCAITESESGDVDRLAIPENAPLEIFLSFDKFFGKKQPLDAQNGIASLVGELLKQGGNIQDAAQYLSVVLQVKRPREEPSTALAHLFGRLMFRYPVKLLEPLATNIEFGSLPQEQRIATLVELFAFLRHPELTTYPYTIERLTLAISSIPYFINHGVTVSGLMVNCWYDIANISLGFKRYRYATKRGYGVDDSGKKLIELESIFESFGGRRINTLGPKHPFQVGYEFIGSEAHKINTPSDWILGPGVTLTFFRAGVAIADTKSGVTFIRNSSPHFGRDLLKYPAYFKSRGELPFAATRSDALSEYVRSLTPEIIERDFKNIMDVELYPGSGNRYARRKGLIVKTDAKRVYDIEHIRSHLNIYQEFDAAFRAFQFDTQLETAWDKDSEGNDKLIGACSSIGFTRLLAVLRREHNDAKEHASLTGEYFTAATVLELHNQAYPPFSPYARLVVDDDVLKTLEYLAGHGWNPTTPAAEEESDVQFEDELDESHDLVEEFYINSGVLQFFQTALSTQSELIVVPFDRR